MNAASKQEAKRVAARAAWLATSPVRVRDDFVADPTAALAAQAARQAEQRIEAARRNARRLWAESQEWPRCGENWGMYPGEEAADEFLFVDNKQEKIEWQS